MDLNSAWKSTCRAVLGGEVGELSECEEWLSGYVPVLREEKSCISGKKVSFACKNYSPASSFIAFDEIDFGKKFGQLNINEIKDLESLLEAVQERIAYCGNIILGSSSSIEKSSNVIDSHFVSNSSVVSDSKYIAYSSLLRRCEYMFGVLGDGGSKFAIKTLDSHRENRVFECWATSLSSDGYYSAGCKDCREFMFSFGLRGKSYVIGNLELPKDKYLDIKKRLTAEIRKIIIKNKRIFSILDTIKEAEKLEPETKISSPEQKGLQDSGPIEEAFEKTTKLLLERKLNGLDDYSFFLQSDMEKRKFRKSAFSQEDAPIAVYLNKLIAKNGITKRFATEDEMMGIGKHAISIGGVENLRIDAVDIAKKLHKIAYCTINGQMGQNHNAISCVQAGYSENCYKCDACVYSKKCAYSFWPRESEHIFGSWIAWASQFCMKAHYSKNLARCFEVDNCSNCSDLYFCHNCENVHESMFCFNVKNLRYAIGNAEVGREKYLQIKKILLQELSKRLETNKTTGISIYKLSLK